MKKLTDYNFNLLSDVDRMFLEDWMPVDDYYSNTFLGKAVLVDIDYTSKVIEVKNAYELYNIYCGAVCNTYIDLLPLTSSASICYMLEIFKKLEIPQGGLVKWKK